MGARPGVQTGARAGLLPFSHQQISGHYQLQAMEAWRQGDRERAALYADQALRVGPTSPSMIQLREDIRADNAAPWRSRLDSLDLLPEHIRRNGTTLGFPQGVPADKAEPAPVVAPPVTEPATSEALP